MISLRELMDILIREQRDKLIGKFREMPNVVSCATAKKKIVKDLQTAQLAREEGMQQLCSRYELEISKTE